MRRPTWFEDEIRRIGKKHNLKHDEARKFILEKIADLAKEFGSQKCAWDVYNLDRCDQIDEEYYVELFMKEGLSEEVARAKFRSLPL